MTKRLTPAEHALNRVARFYAKFTRPDEGCWMWTAGTDPGGYGKFRMEPTDHCAHRVSYELHVGPIPVGLEIDHQCHNADKTCMGGPTCPHRRCVRPDHLEPATRTENIIRGRGPELTRARRRKLHAA